MFSRREFLVAAAGIAATGQGERSDLRVASPVAGSVEQDPVAGQSHDLAFDENLVALVSDMHIRGAASYHETQFARTVADILALRPLPRNVIIYGDLAFCNGDREDYAKAKRLLCPLVDAGLKVTIGMGNHDRRQSFLEYFPEYAARTKVEGKIVSVVETPHADFLLLDSLLGDKVGVWGPVDGALDEAQHRWVLEFAASHPKPLIVGAHHNYTELAEKKFAAELSDCPNVLGYIHGHDHRWRPGWYHPNYRDRRVLRTLCLPSSGHWGDIGYVLMELKPDKAVARLQMRDFFFPAPATADRVALPVWQDIIDDYAGQRCTFRLPVK